ncbi:DDE_3 domain-containing protein [Trichonephila clavipes]|nr:DDE_3 domain-containing protein [Trichonephila clavipes]
MAAHTHLQVFERGNGTAEKYWGDFLEPYVCFFTGAVGLDFILMEDNARSRRDNLAIEFLESEDIFRMDCPARSPDHDRIKQFSSNCVPWNPGIPQGISRDSMNHNKKN